MLNRAISAFRGCLGTDQAAAIFEPFAGQHASEAIGDALVLPEHITDLPRAPSNIACGDINIVSNMTKQFCHE